MFNLTVLTDPAKVYIRVTLACGVGVRVLPESGTELS
jgi:hypothetical protein